MKIKTFASAAVMGALGLLIPLHSSAFGLGKIELSSALNEPLKAVVPITALRLEDNATFQVKLASNEEFFKAGLKRSFLLTQLKFEVVKNAGQTEVLITSDYPVKEPFLDFLIIASTANGRLIREYTVLLDPPKNVFTKPTAPTKQAPKQNSTKKKQIEKFTPTSEIAAVSSQHEVLSSSPDSYRVKSTDTLYNVAKKVRPQSDISVNQMMMALLDNNQSAFIDNNINRLKANSTLMVPPVEQIKQRSKRQALLDVNQQNEAWQNRKKVSASSVADDSSQVAEMQNDYEQESTPASESFTTRTDDGDMARLDLVAPGDEVIEEVAESSLLGDPKIKELTEQLTLAQETIESQAQENNDIQSRMDMMEEQLETLRRLISLKDADLAKVQNSLRDDESQSTDLVELDLNAEVTVNETNSEVEDYFAQIENSINDELTDETMSETTNIDSISSDDVTNSTELGDDLSIAAEIDSENSEPARDLSAEETVPDTKLPLEVAGDVMTGGIDSVKSFYASHRTESLIGGLLALLALIWLALRGRQDESEDYQEESVTVAPVVQDPPYVAPASDTVNVAAPVPAKEEQEVTESFSSEVETRQDEVLVEDEYSSLDGEHEFSSEVEENSKILEVPEVPVELNELAETVETIDEEEHLEFNLDDYKDEAQPAEAIEEMPEQNTNIDDDLLDFNIDDSSSDEQSTAEVIEHAENETLDFGEPLSLDTETLTTDLELNDESLSLDIDDASSDEIVLNLDDDAQGEPLSISSEALEDLPEMESDIVDLDGPIEDVEASNEIVLDAQPDDDVSFDLGEFDGIDEAETKLDLAAAYMDMGDPEGARNILEEVMIDGSDEQKSRAENLISELG